MAIPTFRSLAARRNAKKEKTSADGDAVISPEGTAASDDSTITPTRNVDIKLATKTRKNAILISSIFFFISVIFLILTIIGNINDKTVIRDTYFFRLDLTNIIPASVDNISFVNSLARSLGLHDFYQIGLWNFCEGYNDEGITDCSTPKSLYYFNPVEIILNELLSGATVALPSNVNDILKLIKIASHVMFGCFLTGICMNFISIFVVPLALFSRWWSLPISLWTFIGAFLTTVATVIATVMFVIFRNVITSQTELNIGASLGNQMFGFMWVGAAFSIFGALIHLGLCCCGASRRDVKTGRRKGRKSAYGSEMIEEKSGAKTGRGTGMMGKFRGLGRTKESV